MSASPRVARAATPARSVPTASWSTRILAGVIGGLAGGLVFGGLMAMMGMLPVIASMVGSSSAVIGFGVHLVISVTIGLGLTVPFAGLLTGYGRGAVVGLVYGGLWWVLGPLLLMPLMMGMPLFMIDTAAWMSLMGHLFYGIVLGLTATAVLHRR